MTDILAFPRSTITALLAQAIVPYRQHALPTSGEWCPRSTLEQEERYLQVIPYALLCRGDTVWTYRRAGGDARLDGRRSIGVGGHVDADDAQAELLSTLHAALARELAEELVQPPAAIPREPLAWINEQESAIGRVHIGLVWAIPWQNPEEPRVAHGEKLEAVGFRPLSAITRAAGFEYWSELAAQALQVQASSCTSS